MILAWCLWGDIPEGAGLRITFDVTMDEDAEAGTNPVSTAVPGDVDGDGSVDLKDAILCLKILAGFADPGEVSPDADVNGNGRIGFEELFFVLKQLIEWYNSGSENETDTSV